MNLCTGSECVTESLGSLLIGSCTHVCSVVLALCVTAAAEVLQLPLCGLPLSHAEGLCVAARVEADDPTA